MGKYNFTERWSKQFKAKRIKPFHRELTTNHYLFYETQAIQENREQAIENIAESSSEQEHRANALASGADEGRDKLRKAAVSCK